MENYTEIPQDVGAEQSLIGAALQGKYTDICAAGCSLNHFNDLRCRAVWSELERMDGDGTPVSVETVCHRIRSHREVSILDVNTMVDACSASVNWPYWFEICGEKLKARAVQQAGLKLVQESGSGCVEDMVAQAETVIYGLTKTVSSDPDTRKTSFQRVITSLEDAHNGKCRGLLTGFPSLDRILGGLRGGQLVVLAARPAVGKSAMAGNMAEHLVSNGTPVAFFSYEMTADELNMRMLSSAADVDLVGDIINQNKDTAGRLETIHKTSSHIPELAMITQASLRSFSDFETSTEVT